VANSGAVESEDVDAARASIRSRVASRYSNLDSATAVHLHKTLFGKSRPLPDYESLSNLGPEDVAAFHQRAVAPRNTALVLVGDFDEPAVRARATSLFGAWKGGEGSTPPVAAEMPAPKGVHLGELVQASSAGFGIGRAAPGFADPLAPAAMVLAEMLTTSIPEIAAANRSWMLRATAVWDPGSFRVRGLTDLTYPVDGVAAILNAMSGMRKGAFADAAIEEAKMRALGSWASRFATPLQRLVHAEVSRRAGLGEDHVAAFHAALGSVAKADLARAAQSLLNPADFHLVLLANSTLSGQAVSTLREPVEKLDLTIPAPRPLDVRTDAPSLERGRQWLSRMQQSMGGADRLAAIKDLMISTEGMMSGGKSKVVDRMVLAPLTFRQDQETPESPFSVFYNGAIGWVGASGGRISALSPGLLAQVRSEVFRALPLLALSDRDSKRTVSHLGSNIVVVTGEHGNAVRLYLDEQTALPIRLYYQSKTQSGVPTNMEESWTEWKEMDGIKFPGVVVVRQDGRKIGEMRLTGAKVNSGLKLDDLERKP
jgi:hypothetical protein